MRTQIGIFMLYSCILGNIVTSSIAETSIESSIKPKLIIQGNKIVLSNSSNDVSLSISLKSPEFVINSKSVPGVDPIKIIGNINKGEIVILKYPEIIINDESKLKTEQYIQYSKKEMLLRKWASYQFTGKNDKYIVEEIVLEKFPKSVKGVQAINLPPQSYPILLDGFYVGIEYPIASTRIDSGSIIVAHKPGIRLQSGNDYLTRKSVYGFSDKGRERKSFERYITLNSPQKTDLHINYNSWWTTGIPYSDNELMTLIDTFKKELYDKYNISFDSFAIDLGWSDKNTIWKLNESKFSNGLAVVQNNAESMKSKLGLWMSPSSAYPGALDNIWAKQNGYLTIPGGSEPDAYPLLCLSDKKYVSETQANLTDMVNKYNIRMFKFDSARLICPESDHGHEPGILSAEALAEGMISILTTIRNAAPDVYFESNAFGAYQSPWWLFYMDVLLSDLGADAPYGFVPAPVYRESYTTARDFYNMRGDMKNICPISDLHVCGFVHQTEDPFINDAVMTIMRGCKFLPAYLNPKYMDEKRWKNVADLLKWAKRNWKILKNTDVILPKSTINKSADKLPSYSPVPKEAYGYAHWNKDSGLIALRNPWISKTTITLTVDESIGIPKGIDDISAVSLYPEIKLYADELCYGDSIDISLAPYETVVLSLKKDNKIHGIKSINEIKNNYINIKSKDIEINRVSFSDNNVKLLPNQTNYVYGIDESLTFKINADIDIDSSDVDLLILLEDRYVPVDPICNVKINGKESNISYYGSDTGWAADVSRIDFRSEQWLFLKISLKDRSNKIEIEMLNRSKTPKVSVWILAHKPGNEKPTKYPNSLPQPETIYLDSACLLDKVDINDINVKKEIAAPKEKIDGIFIDSLSGELFQNSKINTSIAGHEMVINGRQYFRGIGTTPGNKIDIPVSKKYTRFQSWVGVDAGIELWDESMLEFKVYADGILKWKSDIMERRTPAAFVDIDIAGSETISLEVVNRGTEKTSARSFNNADWADARFLY